MTFEFLVCLFLVLVVTVGALALTLRAWVNR